MVELRVEDDGVGFPEGLDFQKATTLGLQIANALLSQLEATMELDRTNGTVFTVKLCKSSHPPRL
jgi:two-component sensor histidine kinase